MRFDCGGIDQHIRRRPACRSQSAEDIHPDTFGSPTYEPIVECLARAIDGGCVNPAAARLQHMDNATDHPTIIHPRLAACVNRKMWHDPRELPVIQPELISLHQWSPFGDLESDIQPRRNHEASVRSRDAGDAERSDR